MHVNREPVTFQTNGLRLVGDRWSGPGTPKGSVLLLHGGGQTRHSWRGTGTRLAGGGWDSYALDARGHGDSDWSPIGDYSLTALVADLVAVQDTIGEKPVLVGASMGGMTALIAEGEIGGVARGLVLVDIVARPEPAGVERIRAFMSQAPNGFASLEQVADAVAAYNPQRRRPGSVDGLRRNVRLKEDGRWYWHWDPAFLQGGEEPTREAGYERACLAASRISIPTMVVHGGQSDIVSTDGVREMMDLIPGATTVEVSSAGHMVAGDDNDIFTANLAVFLNSL